MRRFFKIVLCLLVLLIIAAIAVPFVVPADKIKNEVLAQITAKTGRAVSIDHMSFAIFPTLSLDAETVKIGNPAWAGTGNMAEIKTLKIGLELIPLLHGEYKLKELVLDAPVITLVQQKDRANWNFGSGEAAPNAPQTQAKTAPAANPNNILNQLHLDEITIKDGSVTFHDETANKTTSLSEINLDLKAPNLNEKASLKFSAMYGGKKADIALTLDKPLAFQNGGETTAKLDAAYGALAFNWEGQTALKSGKPVMSGKLNIPTLDIPALTEKDGKEAKPAAAASNAPAPQGAAHWSDAPIDLSALNSADMDVTLTIGSLKLTQTTLTDVNATVKLHQGNLQIETGTLKAFGGTVKIGIGATTGGAMSFALQSAGTQAEPLLHDFAGYDRLSGTINLDTKLTANGHSQRQLVGSLAGSGNFALKDGKLKGVDLAALLHNVTGAQSEDTGTAFSELSGTFTAATGIITNNDLKMSSSLLRMTGAGTADLPNWQEHFLLKPALVAGGSKDAPGIVIPVQVEGPLDHPHYQPDLKSALEENLKNPGQLKQGIKDIGKQLKQGGGLQNLLR